MDENQFEHEVQRIIRVSRIAGWVAIVVGGALLSVLMFRYLVASGSDRPHLGTVAYAALFPLIGVVYVLNPKEKLASNLRKHL
jgi:hypothetical protein